jgi:hypothetical protein
MKPSQTEDSLLPPLQTTQYIEYNTYRLDYNQSFLGSKPHRARLIEFNKSVFEGSINFSHMHLPFKQIDVKSR